MSGRARLFMWAVLFVAAVALLAFCEGRYSSHGVCDDIRNGCPGVSPSVR